MGGFSSLSVVQTRALGPNAPPGGTALQGEEWITGGRQKEEEEEVRFSSRRDVRGDHTRAGRLAAHGATVRS